MLSGTILGSMVIACYDLHFKYVMCIPVSPKQRFSAKHLERGYYVQRLS